jgi:hypothetical protein
MFTFFGNIRNIYSEFCRNDYLVRALSHTLRILLGFLELQHSESFSLGSKSLKSVLIFSSVKRKLSAVFYIYLFLLFLLHSSTVLATDTLAQWFSSAATEIVYAFILKCQIFPLRMFKTR